MLADIVSKNGNLLLNVVLYADGSLPPESEQLLAELAAWMQVNSEAIHGTRPWKVHGEGPTETAVGMFKEKVDYTARDIRFTTKGDSLYAIALGQPSGNTAISALAAGNPLEPRRVRRVRLLGHRGVDQFPANGQRIGDRRSRHAAHAACQRLQDRFRLTPPPWLAAIPATAARVFVIRLSFAPISGGRLQRRERSATMSIRYWFVRLVKTLERRSCGRMCLSLLLPLAFAPVATAQPGPVSLSHLPLEQNGGTWDSGHVQGIAVDVQGGYIYYSFTNLLAKYDFSGKLVGTLVGWTGHLGDLDFNAEDGKLYGSLEYKKDKAFYIAVIDVRGLDRIGVEASKTGIFRTVYLPEVAADYSADLNGDGVFDGDDGKFRGEVAASPDHRYACSGIDGVSFGPEFGRSDGRRYLTVAYGIYGNTARADNDHQVLLQYDIADWDRYASPLTEAAPHRRGPAAVHGKYFVRTGNTQYGVQNLSYDETLQRWFLGVYPGKKPSFPNYLLFAVDAREKPVRADLVGVPGPGGKGWEQGMLLGLARDGLKDPTSGIRGWNQKADVGSQPVGQGLFYFSVNSGGKGRQGADLTLMRWTGNPQKPFVPVTAEEQQRPAKAPAGR